MNYTRALKEDYPSRIAFGNFYKQNCGGPNRYLTDIGDKNVAKALAAMRPERYNGMTNHSVQGYRQSLGLKNYTKRTAKKQEQRRGEFRYSDYLNANFPTAESIAEYVFAHIDNWNDITAAEKDIAVTKRLSEQFPDMYGGMSHYAFTEHRKRVGAHYVRRGHIAGEQPESEVETAAEASPDGIAQTLESILAALLRIEAMWK